MGSSKVSNVHSSILFYGGGDSGNKVQFSCRFFSVERPLVIGVFSFLRCFDDSLNLASC